MLGLALIIFPYGSFRLKIESAFIIDFSSNLISFTLILRSDVLFTDDSIIPLHVEGNGEMQKARLGARA
jgi:hypothetical protein